MRDHVASIDLSVGGRSLRTHLTPLQVVGIASLALFLLVWVDVALRPRAFYDLWVTRTVQRVDGPGAWDANHAVDWLTDSRGAVLAWAVTLGAFLVASRWATAAVIGLLPIGGAINLLLGQIVGRTRPHLETLVRDSANWEERSFPSGHIMGAVLLYGFLFVAARGIGNPWVRSLARTGCLTLIVASGVQRIWIGAHWPSDVLGGFALGLFLLTLALALWDRLRVIAALPGQVVDQVRSAP